MEKLLWKKLWKDKSNNLFLWGAILILFPFLYQITKGFNSIVGYAVIQSALPYFNREMIGNRLQLSEHVFLVPMDIEERKRLVRKMFQYSCLLDVMIVTFGICLFLIMETLLFLTYGGYGQGVSLYWWKILLIFINVLSIVHTNHYYDYLVKTKAGVPEMLYFVQIGKAILWLVGIHLEEQMVLLGILLYLPAGLVLFTSDIYYAKKYLKDVISFYADYDYSRGNKKF